MDLKSIKHSNDIWLVWHLNWQVVVALVNVSGHWMKAGRWAWMCWVEHCPNERNVEQNISKMSHLHAFLAQCNDDRSKLNQAWTKKVESDCFTLKRRQFHTWVQATSLAHRWSRAPKFSHLCGVGPRLVKMLPLTSWDSPTILFWLVQVLHRLIAICQSAAWVLGIQEPTFRRKLSQHRVLRCVRGQGPDIFGGTTKPLRSPEYCRHIWKVASFHGRFRLGELRGVRWCVHGRSPESLESLEAMRCEVAASDAATWW